MMWCADPTNYSPYITCFQPLSTPIMGHTPEMFVESASDFGQFFLFLFLVGRQHTIMELL